MFIKEGIKVLKCEQCLSLIEEEWSICPFCKYKLKEIDISEEQNKTKEEKPFFENINDNEVKDEKNTDSTTFKDKPSKSQIFDLGDDDFQNNYDRGMYYYKKGVYDKALIYFNLFLKDNPENIDIYIYIAKIHYKNKDIEKAITIYEKILSIEPKSIEAYYGLSISFYKVKKLDQAMINCRRVIQLDPKYINAYFLLGCIYYIQEQIEEAISIFQRAIQLKPDHKQINIILCILYNKMKNYNESLLQLKEAIKLNPNAEFYNLIAVTYFKQNKIEKSFEYLKKGVELYPNSYLLHYNLACLYFILGDFNNVISECKHSINLNPDYIENYNLIGMVLYKNNKIEESIDFFKKSINIYPNPVGYKGLGLVYNKQERFNLAIEMFNRALEKSDKQDDIYSNIGESYRLMGDFDESMRYFLKSIELNNENQESYIGIGKIYVNRC